MSPRLTRTFSFAAAGLLFAVSIVACDRGDHPGQIGQPAPTFSITDGQSSIDLAKLRGHVVVLNFWASWCPPCLEELPSLNAMQRELPQINVIGVSMDLDKDAYAGFLKRHPTAFVTVDDPEQRANALYSSFRPPETYIIDKAGNIRRKFIGPQDWTSPEIIDFLKKLSA